jgi:ribokinase
MSDSDSAPASPPTIAVVGSLNVDTLLSVPELPLAGHTVAALGTQVRFGGKGANQALAALRQGGLVSLIGCVGSDAAGQAYYEHLMEQGINMAGVVQYPNTNTGNAIICVDARGENFIVTQAGANQMLSAADVLAQTSVIEGSDTLLCQLEVPVEAVVCALQHASSLGKVTILNPSPLSAEFPWGQVGIDFLIVNEREAASLLGYFVESTAEAPQVRAQMADMGVNTLIITRGAEPTFAFSAHQALKVPPPTVEAIDTVGAGDAFAGAFAVHWAQTGNLLHSLRRANIAGALTTTQPGAQDAIPTREEVDAFGGPIKEDDHGLRTEALSGAIAKDTGEPAAP